LAAGLGFGIVVDDISAPIGAGLDGPEHRRTIDSTTAPVPALRCERMFIRAYVELNLPIAEVEPTLLRTPAEWIPGLAASAEEHGDHLLTEVGFPVSQLHVGKRVEIDLGRPVHTPGRTWLPVSWRATGPRGVFPTLEGELEVAALGLQLTQLGLSARYKPPFGALGDSVDRALLHRVAEATIRDFVERVALALRQRRVAA
jgi:hypothetical protein